MEENQKQRATFGSRLGFLLVSAGCAIGIGNVWKFPYLCGKFGGAAFILVYLIFLLILGIPVMTCEFAIGRRSQSSIALAYDKLEPKGTRWHWLKWWGIAGNYLLMMYYTTVSGWLLYYCFRCVRGDFQGVTSEIISGDFTAMLQEPGCMLFWTVLICVIGFLICYFGLRKGVEKVTKVMMTALLVLMVALAIHSVCLKGAGAGIRFYLVPDFQKMKEQGIGNVIFAALSQAFFTLSIGIGSMLIFGSYIGKERSLAGEAVTVTILDTFVALMAGLIVIPSAFAFGIEPDAGPSLIFITIPNIFTQMAGGRVWGSLFFLFMTFAALTTVVAVFENIVAFDMDRFSWTRKKSVLVSAALVIVLSIPCVLGFNAWAEVQLLGKGSSILDFEDFIVSNNLLPLGSLAFVLFCTRRNGWGWQGFLEEADQGNGMKVPPKIRWYLSYVLPLIIMVIYIKGYYDMFAPKGTGVLIPWLIVGAAFLGITLYCALYAPKLAAERAKP